MLPRRSTSKAELYEVTMYWCNRPNCSGNSEESSLIRFLRIFTPKQIKGAMHLATRKKQPDPFKYLCGILHNWCKELEAGNEPKYFEIDE
jgi:hypothetical protein